MSVRPIPEGYHTVTPYLVVEDVAKLLPFLEEAFGAQVKERLVMPDGSVGHAEIQIGDSRVMLGQAREGTPAMPAMIHLYVEDASAWYERSLKAGATSMQEVSDQFYGDRSGGVKDPQGNLWWMATRIEDLTSEEIARRMESMGS